ncbi:MAG: hypothetical protein ACW99Q_30185, partial [Candidatus Kariarchaeaceae archaeon]
KWTTLTSRLTKRKFLIAAAGGIAAVGVGYLAKENWIPKQSSTTNFISNKTETTTTDQMNTSVLPPSQRETTTDQMNTSVLPPGQREIDTTLLRDGILIIEE